METTVQFLAGDLVLSGLLDRRTGTRGMIVTHPHPLYGGNMTSPVVEAAVRGGVKSGLTSLRFNFRGVGDSQGHFGDGIGEMEDLLGAIGYLEAAGVKDITLVGYSFGSWVIAHLENLPGSVTGMVFIAPPVAFMDFSRVGALPLLRQVICGEEDEFGPPGLIRSALTTWNPSLEVQLIDGADHFFFGCFDQLETTLRSCLAEKTVG